MPAPSAKLGSLRRWGLHCRQRYSAWGRRCTLSIDRRTTALAMVSHTARPHSMTYMTPRAPRKTSQIPRNPLLTVSMSRAAEARINVVVNVVMHTPREASGRPLATRASVGASDARLELATKTYDGYCCPYRRVCRRGRQKRGSRRSAADNTLTSRGARERKGARRGRPAAPRRRMRNRHEAR